jgi:methyl-accepting chemotaxis protein
MPTPERMDYFELISSIGATLAITACAAIFEGTRRRSTEDANRALDALRAQRAELENLRREAELARETAVAELSLKGEFVELMTRQAREQSAALDETRRAMAGVTSETRKIGDSVQRFAEASKATSTEAETVDKLNDETQASIEDMTAAVEQNAASIEEMRMTLREVAKHVENLLQNVESTSSAMSELDASVGTVEGSANEASQLASAVIRAAQHGTEVVGHSRSGIETISQSAQTASALISVLGERVSEIHAILDVIENVSDRTNLLALNAAIIAAQAGEAGRGFAVVADQIKALAEQTGGSTKQIEQIVAGVQSQTRSVIAAIGNSERAIAEGARLSEDAETALKEIVRSAEQSNLVIKSIADATREQAGSISQVAKDTERVTQTVSSVANTVREQVRTSEQIAQATERLSVLAPKVQSASGEQARGFQRVRETASRLDDMVQTLQRAQSEQTKQSERVLSAVESVHQTQMQQVQHIERLQKGAAIK